MDRDSQVLVQDLPPHVSSTWAALSERYGVSLTTLYHRAHWQPSMKEKAQGQQYLILEDEKVFVTFFLTLGNLFE